MRDPLVLRPQPRRAAPCLDRLHKTRDPHSGLAFQRGSHGHGLRPPLLPAGRGRTVVRVIRPSVTTASPASRACRWRSSRRMNLMSPPLQAASNSISHLLAVADEYPAPQVVVANAL